MEDLDAVRRRFPGNGYSTTMITGNPGTAKTTIGGAFAEAAAKRGERTVYVAFDETGEEIVRNLTSVNIHLQKHIDSGVLKDAFRVYWLRMRGGALSVYQNLCPGPSGNLPRH